MEISNSSIKKINKLYYGHSYKESVVDKQEKLSLVKWALNKLKHSMLRGSKVCYTPEEVSRLVSKARGLVPKQPRPTTRCDFTMDATGQSKWNMDHPYCVSRESWEELAHKVCGELGLVVDIKEIGCDLVFDLSRKVINPNLLLAFSVRQEACKMNWVVKRSEEECKLDWTLLLEKLPECALNFKTYLKLVECKLNYNTILEVYKCGLSFEVKDDGAYLKSLTRSYKLDSIQFKTLVDSSKSSLLEFTTTIEKFKEDFNK
jgi:hypothetical protein